MFTGCLILKSFMQLVEKNTLPNGICIIEWGEIIKEALPNDYLEIKFSKSEIYENERNLSIIPHGNRFNYLDFNKL